VEGLERDTEAASSDSCAGEGDVMPAGGLRIGRLHVTPAGMDGSEANGADGAIRLGNSQNGWGTGCHPTTRLCLEFLCDVLQGGEMVLDYGTGSGVLGIGALKLGASYVTAVDVDAEVLMTAQQNFELNEVDQRAELLHVREVIPGCIIPGADVAVANILVGQLVRPSMVAALCSNIAPNGLLCLSGIRPEEVQSLKDAYDQWLEWEDTYYEEAVPGPEGECYWGTWSRLVGRRKSADTAKMLEEFSELAVA
jgi:ribosomal protein L11 methylase PrmA